MKATAGTKMNDSQKTEAGERSVLLWGGLAGMLGSLLMIFVFVFVGVFVTLETSAAYLIERFPEIRAGRTVENSLFSAVVILWVPPFLALYRALWRENLAPALFGSVLSIMGLAIWMAQNFQHVAQISISDPYHASGSPPEKQATLVFLWQATQGIFDAMLLAGFVLLLIGLVCLGVAMFRAPAFGKGFGGAGVVLGLLGFGGASLMVVDPASVLGPVAGLFTLIIFHFVVGWRLYRLSRYPAGSFGGGEKGARAEVASASNSTGHIDAVRQGGETP